MASWDFSSPGLSQKSNEPPPPGKEQEQEARSAFDMFPGIQPRPPGEEDIDLPSLQYASSIHASPMSTFPITNIYSSTNFRYAIFVYIQNKLYIV